MEATATAKYVRMTPRKVRFVMDTIRGKYADEALDQLKFTPNHAAAEIAKVLRSAMANAENNLNMDPDTLRIARCFVDGGPTQKRVQPRAQGRAYRILKRTSHITVVVEDAPPRPRKQKTVKKQFQPLRAPLSGPSAGTTQAEREEQTTVPLTVGEAAPTDVAASAPASGDEQA